MTPQFVTFSYMASMFGDVPVVGFFIATFAFAYFVVWYAVRPPMRRGNYYGQWWHGAGSERRFSPRNEAEEYAYAAGLRDSIRIAQVYWHENWDEMRDGTLNPSEARVRIAQRIHKHAQQFESNGSQAVNPDYSYRGKFFNRKITK